MTNTDATPHRNVLGGELKDCSLDPMTGFYRDGCCHTGPEDLGQHVVCAIVTREFLDDTRARGNDLETPRPPSFKGLKPGDRWCLCAARWLEAHRAGTAPPVALDATHEAALQTIPLDTLKAYAADDHA